MQQKVFLSYCIEEQKFLTVVGFSLFLPHVKEQPKTPLSSKTAMSQRTHLG